MIHLAGSLSSLDFSVLFWPFFIHFSKLLSFIKLKNMVQGRKDCVHVDMCFVVNSRTEMTRIKTDHNPQPPFLDTNKMDVTETSFPNVRNQKHEQVIQEMNNVHYNSAFLQNMHDQVMTIIHLFVRGFQLCFCLIRKFIVLYSMGLKLEQPKN